MKKIFLMSLVLCSLLKGNEQTTEPLQTVNTEQVVVSNTGVPNYEKATRGLLYTIFGAYTTYQYLGNAAGYSQCIFSPYDHESSSGLIGTIWYSCLAGVTWQFTKYGMRIFNDGMHGK